MKKSFIEKFNNEKDGEVGTINEDSDKDQEQKVEAQIFEVNTVKDFIDSLKWNYDEAKNEKMRRKISYQIIKIEIGLRAARIDAREVRVSKMPDGTLGLFNPQNKKIDVSEDLLSDFNADTQLLETVFVHEKTHKEGIYDEGLTQLRVRQKIPSAAEGIYPAEQKEAQRTFYKTGIDNALGLYDIDHPEKLVDYYLEVEIRRAIPERKRKLFTKNYVAKIAKEQADKLSKKFKEGAEKLFGKLESKGYNFQKKIEDILTR